MTLHQRIIASMLAVLVATATVGCSTTRTIYPLKSPAAATPFGGVKAGDEIFIQTHDGRRERIVVRAVESDAIISREGTRYPQNEVAQIQRKQFSPLKAALWTAGGIAGTIAILAAMLSQMAVFPS